MRMTRRLVQLTAACLMPLSALAASGQGLAQGAQEFLPVPAVTIYPGDPISSEMLTERAYPAGTTARFPVATASRSLIGKVARRTLPAGKAIPQNAVADADAVMRGTTTRAVFELGGLTVTTLVTPLQSGPVGASIQARNIDSGQVIAGQAQADGTIRIGVQ